MKKPALSLAALLLCSALLASCGGGDSSSTTSKMEPTEPTPAEMARDQAYEDAKRTIMRANDRAIATQTLTDAITNDDLTPEQVSSLRGELVTTLTRIDKDAATASQAAYNAAKKEIMEADTEEEVMDAHKKALEGGIINASDQANLVKEKDDKLAALARTAREAKEADDRRKASNVESMAVAKAIQDHKVGDNSSITSITSITDLDVKVTPDERSVDGTAQINLKRNDTGQPLEGKSAKAPLESWTATEFSFDDDDSNYKGVVVTNRGGAEPGEKVNENWLDYFYPDSGGTRSFTSSPPLEGLVTASGGGSSGALNLSSSFTDVDVPDLSIKHFAGDIIPSSRPKSGTEASGEVMDNGDEIEGMFLGVRGTYACGTETGCQVNWIADQDSQFDDSVSITGAITFTPTVPDGGSLEDLRATYTRDAEPDNDYLTFGYWVTTTTEKEKIKHKIETFAEASAGYGAVDDSPGSLRGKATYSGGAAGIYVLKTGDPIDTDNSLRVYDGEFVADVALTAQFGVNDGSVAAETQWTIEGEVSDFESTDGSHDLSPWTLKLNSVDLASSRGTPNTPTGPTALTTRRMGTTTGSVNGVDGAAEGEWSGTFYGNVGTDTTTQSDAAADDHPEAVIGEFNGHFSNGHVVGAYGAEKDDDDE
ncbi:hypothetical protein [Candidatus Synechococcus spongiarum]|uniref:hypothetical protein n=1 Tax=Candidatus Synechococcus spongiarum TaxID=431041 RepID=UPI0004715E2A|nr:hypothetical protein [Candidatus Synechococcus spongiarum]